tara:strand:+ start:525 stop:878 length:354 start_codon:yes stop_codon:yes gene_type:complete
MTTKKRVRKHHTGAKNMKLTIRYKKINDDEIDVYANDYKIGKVTRTLKNKWKMHADFSTSFFDYEQEYDYSMEYFDSITCGRHLAELWKKSKLELQARLGGPTNTPWIEDLFEDIPF